MLCALEIKALMMRELSAGNNDFYVYEHIRLDDGSVFYVGKGRHRRFKSTNGRNQYWRRVVKKCGGFEFRFVAKNLSESEAFDLEVSHIDRLKKSGVKLTNLTNGGEGPSGIIPTDEHKRKISIAKTGVKRPKDVVDRVAKAKTIPMVGRRFGELTVIRMHGEKVSGRHPTWECLCDCGNLALRTSIALRNGRKPSCGCVLKKHLLDKYDLTGLVFGRLKVKEFSGNRDSKRNLLWTCICDCGNTKEIASEYLKSGHTRSCGCLHKDVVSKSNKIRGEHEEK